MPCLSLRSKRFLAETCDIGRARALLGSLLNLKPIVHVEDGEVAPGDRVRSRARGIERVYALTAEVPGAERIIVQHTGAANDAEAILAATDELIRELMSRNALAAEAMVSCIFTLTEDLNAEFPAVAARRLGLDRVPLLCARELPVPGAMPRVIRTLAVVYPKERIHSRLVNAFMAFARERLGAARGGDETVRSYVPSMGQVLLRRFQLVTQFRHALGTGQIDVWEINEAFSAVAITSARKLGLDPEQINKFGGAVAMGHPIGASGARLVGTVINQLRKRGGGLGIAAICSGGGQGDALLIRVD